MRRAAMIIAAILCSIPSISRERYRQDPRLTIKAEYRQDALDYDDTDKRFFRESACLSFMKSSVGFTHVHIGANKENRFSGHIRIKGLSPHFDCILGHYYINFGAGLIAGKKAAVSPDLFSRRLIISGADPFTPCVSGNPLYCFQGAGAGLTMPFRDASVSLRSFCSFRNRYIRNDRYYRDITGSSINSILLRTRKDYRYSEPAEINDYGGAVIFQALEHLTLQAYFIYTSLRRSNNHRLLWNYGDRQIQEGERAFYAYGCYAEYHDDHIMLFMELGFPNRILSSIAGSHRTERGYGLLYGLHFRHPACSISFSGKHADKRFYSPYSSGGNYAETAWMADITVRPLKPFSLGGSFFAEKKITPAGNEQYLPYLRREQAFVRYGEAEKQYFSVRFSHVENGKKNGIERRLQIKATTGIFIMRSILLSFSGTAQQKNRGAFSGFAAAGIKLCLLRYFILNIRYSRFFVAQGDSLYTAFAPYRDSISRGIFVAASSNMVTGVVLFRYRENTLCLRYQQQFTDARPGECRLEASAAFLL